ncbi:ABC transporter ATP-binding protein [bacterium]|nr:ABC transporter ATP-binding protein [bacterium]
MISLNNISKEYDMGHVTVNALGPVSLVIERGEFVAVLGPSGSGKSTMMNILGCLDKPSQGEYLLDNTPVHEFSRTKLARVRNKKVGFVFQSFNLLPFASAYENIELPMLYARMPAKKRMNTVNHLLDIVGLSDRASHRPAELSGGQRQRVAVARALANDPDIILADEPTGNLDTKSGTEIIDLFRRLHSKGKTLIFVTHDEKLASKAKRIIRLLDGKINQDYSVESGISDLLNKESTDTFIGSVREVI